MSRMAKPPGQVDQKKVYMDWANHYLRKTGFTDMVLADLKDISDGVYLPKVIQAVVQGTVPGIHDPPTTDEHRTDNIKICIQFLETKGVNCSTCAPKDVRDGNMRAILSLFYTLSQFKRTNKSSSLPPSMSNRVGDHPASRIGRPTSPGVKSTHGVKDSPPPSRIRPISPSLKSTHGISTPPGTPTLKSPYSIINVPPGSTSGLKLPQSNISTPLGTTSGLKPPQSSVNIPPGTTSGPKSSQSIVNSPPGTISDPKSPQSIVNSPPATTSGPKSPQSSVNFPPSTIPGPKSPHGISTPPGTPSLKSTPALSIPSGTSSIPAVDPKLSSSVPTTSHLSPIPSRRTAGSAIMTSTTYDRPFGQRRVPYRAVTILNDKPTDEKNEGDKANDDAALKQDVEGKPMANGLNSPPEKVDSLQHPGSKSASMLPFAPSVGSSTESPHASPGRSKSLPHVGHHDKLIALNSTLKGGESSPSDLPATESRLKFPGGGKSGSLSGRSTPTSGKSGLVRPPSRITRPASKLGDRSSSKDEPTTAVVNGEEASEVHESKLKLQRKNSGGAVKRHAVIESGTSSLPRNLPKGVLSSGLAAMAPGNYPDRKHNGVPETITKPTDEVSDMGPEIKSIPEPAGTKVDQTTEGLPSSTRILKRPGQFAAPTGLWVRTPNLPSASSNPSGTGDDRSNILAPLAEKSGNQTTSQLPKGPTGLKFPGERKIPGIGSKAQRMIPSLHGRVGLKPREHSSSSDSLDSSTSSDIKPAESSKIDGKTVENRRQMEGNKERTQIPPPLKLSPNDKDVILSPPEDFRGRELGKLVESGSSSNSVSHSGSKDLPRYGRRISPEGMSHEEFNASPKDKSMSLSQNKPDDKTVENNLKNEKEMAKEGKPISDYDEEEVPSSIATEAHEDQESQKSSDSLKDGSKVTLSQPETGQLYSESMTQLSQGSDVSPSSHSDISPKRRSNALTKSEEMRSPLRFSRFEKVPAHTKRARSLSPKSTRRVSPCKATSDDISSQSDSPSSPGTGKRLERTASNDLNKSSSSSNKPLRSSLRNGGKARAGSSSSLDSSKSPKVTISPRSSQLVYLPDEIGLQPARPSYTTTNYVSPRRTTALLQVDRPQSFTDPDIFPKGSVSVVRRASIRSTLSEKLDYRDEMGFLQPHLESGDSFGSTPELLESFENQLTTMRKDIESKERMLTMYESSMADLSTKVHHLKKSLEEKDQEIKHLTEEKHRWYDLEGRSLASRAASEAGGLSDGCLSDSAMDPSSRKASKKKKKPWKRFSFRKKAKEHGDTFSPSLETESLFGARPAGSGKNIQRHLSSKGKPSDLMSISEYSPEHNVETRSTFTLDIRSECGFLSGNAAEEFVTVYEDKMPGAKVSAVLQLGYDTIYSETVEREENQFPLGTLSIAPETSWVTMDTKICDIFMHHISSIDPDHILGLSEDSILHYFVGKQRREIGNALLPPVNPYEEMVDRASIKIVMKGANHNSCDSLAYKTLVSKHTLQSYMAILIETQWLVVMGTKGTCKTSLVTGLARHLAMCVTGESDWEGRVITFNLDNDGLETTLKYLKNDLSKRIHHQLYPPILLLDGVYDCHSLEAILAAASSLAKRPYIISTLCLGSMKGIPLHQLLIHHQIRVITCNPQTEPIAGVLARSLRKHVFQLKASSSSIDPVTEKMLYWLPYILEHLNGFINKFHSNNVALGPRVFMGCPMEQNAANVETWFINLWNHFVIPYLLGTIMAGIETYTADPRLEWIDVRELVVETYPWQPAVNVMKLRTLNPEDVGWNHAVRPQQNRLILMKDDAADDTRSVLLIKQSTDGLL